MKIFIDEMGLFVPVMESHRDCDAITLRSGGNHIEIRR